MPDSSREFEQTNSDFLRLAEAALLVNSSQEYLRFLIHKKRLRASKQGNKLYVSKAYLYECFKNINHRTTRNPFSEQPPSLSQKEVFDEVKEKNNDLITTSTVILESHSAHVFAANRSYFFLVFLLSFYLIISSFDFTGVLDKAVHIAGVINSFVDRTNRNNNAQILQELSHKVSISVELNDANVEAGDIVSLSDGAFHLSWEPMDESMVGVVGQEVDYTQTASSSQLGINLISGGTALVRVSSINGVIHAGDYISSSHIHGIGGKATTYGPVLGIALRDYLEPNIRKIERIPVAMHISVRTPLSFFLDHPFEPLRFLFALLVGMGSIIIGFVYLGRFVYVQLVSGNEFSLRNLLKIKFIFMLFRSFGLMSGGILFAYFILSL